MKAKAIVIIVILQLLLLALLFYRRKGRTRKDLYYSFTVLIVVQLSLVVTFFIGGVTQRTGYWVQELFNSVKSELHSFPDAPLDIGDPALVDKLAEQKPLISGPSYSSRESFVAWQERSRDQLRQIFSWDESGADVSPKFYISSETVVSGNIRRTHLWFESYDGTLIPAYLFRPESSLQSGIVVLSGHGEAFISGLEGTAGLMESTENANALELAKAGHVTLAIEFRGFGSLGGAIGTDHESIAYNAILSGTFYNALLIKDVKKAVDLLLYSDLVDINRIGITGRSLGGEIAGYYAALDPRVSAASIHSHFAEVKNQRGRIKFIAARNDHRFCSLIPGKNTKFTEVHKYLLIAPRPLQLVDSNYPLDSLTKAFSLYARDHLLDQIEIDNKHDYYLQEAKEFFDRNLAGQDFSPVADNSM